MHTWKITDVQYSPLRLHAKHLDGSWIHPKLDNECHASLNAPQLWHAFLGHSNSTEEVVRKLHHSRIPIRKSRRVWDLETSGTRTKVPSPHSPCDLSIVDVEIHSGNVKIQEITFSSRTELHPHCHLNVRRFLNEFLPQRWIGRMGNEDLALQFWSPRSPDLKPWHIFSWGFV